MVAAAGAAIVSVNPIRATLEEFFVQKVAAVGAGARADTTRGGDGGH